MAFIEKKKIYLTLLLLFALDVVYWYGDVNNIEFVTDLSILWFLIAFVGFCVSYYLLYKTDIAHKAILNIVITIGVLINLSLIFLWYILKDF